MTLAIDVGGTKTIVAVVDDNGVIVRSIKFETSKNYRVFLSSLRENVLKLADSDIACTVIGLPGNVDRNNGLFLTPGNLPWGTVHIRDDVGKIVNKLVLIENDANLAGLSEAMLLKDKYHKVLFITISTGIGSGIIVNQKIDETLIDSEPGHISLEHDGQYIEWEDFASGRYIHEKYGKYAKDIQDPETWQAIAKNIAAGLIVMIPIIQPDVIVLGGSIGAHFTNFSTYLIEEVSAHKTPNAPIPTIMQAQRPDEAVIYGCYDLANQRQ